MKTSIAIIFSALVSLAANPASAYSFNPPNTLAKLQGKITFHPDGGTPFSCSLTFRFKTSKKIITAIQFHPGAGTCHGLKYNPTIPVSITDANSGIIQAAFNSDSGACNFTYNNVFTADQSGVWTLASSSGQCLTGTLTSHPPVTIVP